MLARLKHEIRQIGLVTLYFLFCFGVVAILKKLMLAAYAIEVPALFTAVVFALVVGKVVVIMDKTRAGTRFDARLPLGVVVLYKTAIYALATVVVLAAEKVFHAYRATGSFGGGLAEAWAHRSRNEILAKVICIGLAFAAYHLFIGIDRRLGEGTLWRLVMSRRGDRESREAQSARH
jgi:hypothetical protein